MIGYALFVNGKFFSDLNSQYLPRKGDAVVTPDGQRCIVALVTFDFQRGKMIVETVKST